VIAITSWWRHDHRSRRQVIEASPSKPWP